MSEFQFCAINEYAQIWSMRRFNARNWYVYHFGTHTSQQDPKDTCAEDKDFIKIDCTLLDEPGQDKRYMAIITLWNAYFYCYQIIVFSTLFITGGYSIWIRHLCLFQCIQERH